MPGPVPTQMNLVMDHEGQILSAWPCASHPGPKTKVLGNFLSPHFLTVCAYRLMTLISQDFPENYARLFFLKAAQLKRRGAGQVGPAGELGSLAAIRVGVGGVCQLTRPHGNGIEHAQQHSSLSFESD